MSVHVKDYYHKTKWIYFSIRDDDLLSKYNTFLEKISADTKTELHSEPVYHKKLLKTRIKFYGDQATYFHSKDVPKVGSSCTCLAVISLDSIFGVNENYYLQVFLKECKNNEKKRLDKLLMTLKISDDFDE